MSTISDRVLAPSGSTTRRGFFGELRQALTGLQRDETISGLLFILPNFLGFLVFSLFPILFALYITFTEWNLAKTPEFIGFANFVT